MNFTRPQPTFARPSPAHAPIFQAFRGRSDNAIQFSCDEKLYRQYCQGGLSFQPASAIGKNTRKRVSFDNASENPTIRDVRSRSPSAEFSRNCPQCLRIFFPKAEPSKLQLTATQKFGFKFKLKFKLDIKRITLPNFPNIYSISFDSLRR